MKECWLCFQSRESIAIKKSQSPRHSIRNQINLDLKSRLFDCHREWNSERAVEMCRDFVFIHFNEFPTCRTQPRSISLQTVEGSLGFAQTIKTSKVDRWFGLIGNQIVSGRNERVLLQWSLTLDVILIVLITKGTPSAVRCFMFYSEFNSSILLLTKATGKSVLKYIFRTPCMN